MKQISLNDDQWLELFIQQQHSGLSQRAFCHQHGLAKTTFSKKRQRLLASPPHAATPAFIQVKPATPAVSVSPDCDTTLLLRYQQTELLLSDRVSPRWLATLLQEISR